MDGGMSQQFQRLKAKLEELFQLDRPDLDFGVYRIMHARSAEISSFLEKDLLPQVREAFAQYRSADRDGIQKELQQAIEQAQSLGADPESLPKVKALRSRLTDAVDVAGLETEVYDHLYNFFRRYYSDGDFLSHRVYRAGVYAIPYEGEEVKLHWANADQYYIKSDEYLRDYTFLLRPDDPVDKMRVHLKLVDAAEGEHGTVKEAEGKNRVFVLAAQDFVAEEAGSDGLELVIRFEYRPATSGDWPADQAAGAAKPPAQKDLNAINERRILEALGGAMAQWSEGLRQITKKADGTDAGTRLSSHLTKYAARNTFDYFIHKDLGGFLRRELDFYIKNEVMHLDDVESESVPRVEQYLSKIKVIRRIAGKIITFLAQLEDFQKRLWLKKKFVTETFWCIRLGCIPEEFYPEIAANGLQREEWVRLFGIDAISKTLTSPGYSAPLSIEFLRAHPTLLVDSRLFNDSLTARLLETVGELNEPPDGLLVQADNFSALSVLRRRYTEQIRCVYIDPPYNTDAGPIAYKNGYRNSSWISMIEGRLSLAKSFLLDGGILCATIDDYQVHELAQILEGIFGREQMLGTAIIRNNPSGRSTVQGVSICHEYAFFCGTAGASIGRLPRTESQLDRFTTEDGQYIDWRNFRKDGGSVTHRVERPKQFYPLYVDKDNLSVRVPSLEWNKNTRAWLALEGPSDSEAAILPIDERGQERVWSLNHLSALEQLGDLEARRTKDGSIQVFRRHYPNAGVLPRSWWDRKTYAAREYGSAALAQLFGSSPFSFAKSPFAVADCLRAGGLGDDETGVVLDYFGGSGTTAHAVVNLNREDGGTRKFILVEQADYFDSVLLPRVQKVVYSPDWKDGVPKRLATQPEEERSPRAIKIIRLESYEDTLNNLDLRRTDAQQSLLDVPEAAGADGLRENYLLKYMLDVEARGSQSLLNVAGFLDPSAYRLKVKRPGSDESREVNVDLLETFNYLVGLTVDHMAAPQTFSAAFTRDDDPDLPADATRRLLLDGHLKADTAGPWWFRSVTGTTPDGQKALIIWRNRPGGETPDGVEQDNLVLDAWFQKQRYSAKDSEFDVIWVNGDNNLENLKITDDNETARWKVRLIEEDFHRLMFEMDGD
jgi:adenine-specific DNA-methyltransferase